MRLVVTSKGDEYVQPLIDDEVIPDPPDMLAEIILFTMDEDIDYDDNPRDFGGTLKDIYHAWLSMYQMYSSYPPPTYDQFAQCWNRGFISGEAVRR